MTDQSDWVSLGEAADILGVHPTTVRHWADSGELPSQRTPGGHRRFRRSDLAQWASVRSRETAPAEARLMMESALGRARMEITEGQLAALMPGYAHLSDEDRRAHGALGRRLLQILAQHIATSYEEPPTLDDVRQLGFEYAQLSYRQGFKLSSAVQIFLFFRDMLTDSVIQMAEMLSLRTASDWGERLRQINHLTGVLLISLIEGYEQQEVG
ncbi:MAG: helix-turn-helix domain-containing protein [Anaerolineae bacterium]